MEGEEDWGESWRGKDDRGRVGDGAVDVVVVVVVVDDEVVEHSSSQPLGSGGGGGGVLSSRSSPSPPLPPWASNPRFLLLFSDPDPDPAFVVPSPRGSSSARVGSSTKRRTR